MDLHFILVYIFIMCVAVFTPVSTTKERVDDAEVAVLARRLYDEIKKRLRNYDDKEDGLQDVDMNMFSLQNETIIKTTNSLKRGAKFLNNSVVGSKEECAKLCFANIQCNIAVFHNKKSFSCYLFNCGTPSVCEFSSHPDYVTMGLPLRKPALSQQKKHENDLAQLPASITSVTTTTTAATATTKTSVSTSSPTTTTTSTTATTTTQAEPEIGKVQVKLFEKCGPLLGDCTDHYTECLTGICVCQEGYHAQEGTCTPKDGDTQIDDHKPGGETSHKVKALPPPVIVKSTEPPVKAATVEPVKPVSSTDESILQPTHVKNDTSAADNNKKIVQDTNTTDKIQPEPHKVAGIIGPKGAGKAEKVVIISKEVIGSAIVHHEAKSDRGAVVALGLGLAVTAVLLLFVGCRLRNMKRKLRRGRPMNSNEADYLINGMYL